MRRQNSIVVDVITTLVDASAAAVVVAVLAAIVVVAILVVIHHLATASYSICEGLNAPNNHHKNGNHILPTEIIFEMLCLDVFNRSKTAASLLLLISVTVFLFYVSPAWIN